MRKLKTHELNRLQPEAARKAGKLPVTVVLDNVRSGLNVGSVFRTADAFAVQELVLCGITGQPPHREITKTALGATESVLWRYEKEVEQAVQQLKEQGLRVLGVEQTTESIPLHELDLQPDEPVALIFGNEVRGLSDSILPHLDGAVEIPQAGAKHSLNVSVSAGVVLWEVFRQFRLRVER